MLRILPRFSLCYVLQLCACACVWCVCVCGVCVRVCVCVRTNGNKDLSTEYGFSAESGPALVGTISKLTCCVDGEDGKCTRPQN